MHALFGGLTFDQLQTHPSIGASWEGFVVEQIIRMAPARRQFYFFRTSAGAEIDLLLSDSHNRLIAIEIKYSLSPKPSKGFRTACDDLSCRKGFVVYPGEDSYPIGKDTFVLPLKELSRMIND